MPKTSEKLRKIVSTALMCTTLVIGCKPKN